MKPRWARTCDAWCLRPAVSRSSRRCPVVSCRLLPWLPAGLPAPAVYSPVAPFFRGAGTCACPGVRSPCLCVPGASGGGRVGVGSRVATLTRRLLAQWGAHMGVVPVFQTIARRLETRSGRGTVGCRNTGAAPVSGVQPSGRAGVANRQRPSGLHFS